MGKIYKQYIFSKILSMIGFLLFCFFSLYILIDYSIHAQQLVKIQKTEPFSVIIYYLFIIVKRLDIALSISMLITTIYTLCKLNIHLELIAFQVGSLNLRKLLRPFFMIAFGLTLILYANFEFFLPKSLKYVEAFELKNFKYVKDNLPTKNGIYVLPVNKTGKLIFSKYHQKEHSFNDAFLYFSNDHIWKIKTLHLKDLDAEGFFAEEFQRTQSGFLEKVGSYPYYTFKNLDIEFELGANAHIEYESEKLSDLVFDTFSDSEKSLQHKHLIQTHLLLKLLTPWLPLLCVLAICPFCISFKRDFSTFKIYGFSLVLFIFFFTVIDICVILSESGRFSPLFVMPLPFFLLFSTFGWNYLKKCYYEI